MAAKYKVGQKVIIAPVAEPAPSPRDSAIELYAGKGGKVMGYYWINTPRGGVFYIYTVRMDADRKDIVLHEDEIQASV